jgi:hypothetical protein
MMTVDPTEQGAQHKRHQIANLIHFTEQQKIIVDLYILEENTKSRHWQLDPEDANIYLEWMNGTNLLRNKINMRLNMTRQQKIAMNNNSSNQKQNIGNNTQQQQQVPESTAATTAPGSPPKQIIRTSSGKEYDVAERPDLAKAATPHHRQPKRYPRYSRS